MENKINIAELLRNCPKGMELDCTMFDNVTFARVDNSRRQFPIEIVVGGRHSKYLTKEGCYHDNTLISEAKCVIFPKGKTTWEGFQRPFKDGDVVAATMIPVGTWIGIFKQYEKESFETYCSISFNGDFRNIGLKNHSLKDVYLATEEEKAKLFDAIKANGYKWNEETKALEKLIEPKFKVGDRVRHKEKTKWVCTIARVADRYYVDGHPMCFTMPFGKQDEYELVPNKFDINKNWK